MRPKSAPLPPPPDGDGDREDFHINLEIIFHRRMLELLQTGWTPAAAQREALDLMREVGRAGLAALARVGRYPWGSHGHA